MMKDYWPRPLTIILKDKKGKKIVFGMPENKMALALIRAVDKPIIAEVQTVVACQALSGQKRYVMD